MTMLNDRDEKYEGQDDSEYHFSDDDVSYEVETESSKATPVVEQKEGSKGLPVSKRMIISLGVFLALVFVVYKMVSPGSSVPSTDITPPPMAQQTMPAKNMTASNPQVSQQNPAPAPMQSQQPVSSAPSSQAATPAQPNIMPVAQAVPAPVPNQPMATAPTSTVAAAAPAAQPVAPTNIAPMQQAVPVATSIAPQPQTSVPAYAQQPTQQQQQPTMPMVVPVQSAVPVYYPNQQMVTTQGSSVDAKIASLAADNEKLMGQLQTEYTQKLNDYETQNKALQDQVQTLNSRVATMETEINQLVKALTQNQQNPNPSPNPNQNNTNNGNNNNNQVSGQAGTQGQPQVAPEPKISYNVQAIIPGRAWLRSDNGDTVTVAEGDVIKDLGRVTKIDPYDGTVEINTGSKSVSLSYGATG